MRLQDQSSHYDAIADATAPPHYAFMGRESPDAQRRALRAFMAARNLKNAPWAKKAGVAEGVVRNFLKGTSDTISYKSAEALAKAAGTTPDEMFGITPLVVEKDTHENRPKNSSEALPESTVSEPRDARPFGAGRKDLPVYGRVVGGGRDDAFDIDNGALLFKTVRPDVLDNIQDAYAVEIRGDSMGRAFEQGNVAWVHPHKHCRPGEYVVIQLHSGHSYIKLLKKRSDREVVVEQFNPKREIHFKAQDVKHVHLVVGQMRVPT